VLLLLDTHVWVWAVEGNVRRIGRRTRQLLARAGSQDALRISPATVFELTALHTAGRVRLTRPIDQWVRDALEAAGVRIAALSPVIALDAGQIPRAALGDPLDRLLVATARQMNATFLTSDSRILEYAVHTGNVHAHDASR
jgi:PIN domain nuclease of toxin-antitoxin system